MMLLRLSGHSGAGKTRLINALPQYGISCPKVLRYTSRPARKEEVHGLDYYFPVNLFGNCNSSARNPWASIAYWLRDKVVFFSMNDNATADDGIFPIKA
jgi:hypothetical protein